MIDSIKKFYSKENDQIDIEQVESSDYLDKKRQEAINWMGDKWILHPNNHIKKFSKRKIALSEKKS